MGVIECGKIKEKKERKGNLRTEKGREKRRSGYECFFGCVCMCV